MKSLPPDICEKCPLPDCYPKDPRCPVLREKAERKGVSLPEVPADAPVRVTKHDGIVPEEFTDQADYHRKYNREYNARFRKVLLRVYLKREDIEILRGFCKRDGRRLEDEVVRFLEAMLSSAKKSVDGGDRS